MWFSKKQHKIACERHKRLLIEPESYVGNGNCWWCVNA